MKILVHAPTKTLTGAEPNNHLEWHSLKLFSHNIRQIPIQIVVVMIVAAVVEAAVDGCEFAAV